MIAHTSASLASVSINFPTVHTVMQAYRVSFCSSTLRSRAQNVPKISSVFFHSSALDRFPEPLGFKHKDSLTPEQEEFFKDFSKFDGNNLIDFLD